MVQNTALVSREILVGVDMLLSRDLTALLLALTLVIFSASSQSLRFPGLAMLVCALLSKSDSCLRGVAGNWPSPIYTNVMSA